MNVSRGSPAGLIAFGGAKTVGRSQDDATSNLITAAPSHSPLDRLSPRRS
jgi:hypothetical protein